jgi:ABC-type siderophore export system fused ATPase/permease subunit
MHYKNLHYFVKRLLLPLSYQSMLGAVVYSLLFVATTAQGWIGRVETLIRARIHFEEQQKLSSSGIQSTVPPPPSQEKSDPKIVTMPPPVT